MVPASLWGFLFCVLNNSPLMTLWCVLNRLGLIVSQYWTHTHRHNMGSDERNIFFKIKTKWKSTVYDLAGISTNFNLITVHDVTENINIDDDVKSIFIYSHLKVKNNIRRKVVSVTLIIHCSLSSHTNKHPMVTLQTGNLLCVPNSTLFPIVHYFYPGTTGLCGGPYTE